MSRRPKIYDLVRIPVLGGCLVALAHAESEFPDVESVAKLSVEGARSPSIEGNLRVICDELGGRMTGSASMKRAVQWAIAAFRQAGVDQVHAEGFTVPSSWREGATRLEVTAPSSFLVHGVSSAWSPATLASGIEGEVLAGGSGAIGFILRMAKEARGKILLIRLDEV